MSDSETSAAPHPTLGGKSLETVERPRYKSWRKKYRKVRTRFDVALEENKRFFKEEQKLESIAKRLREELDGLLELCLDVNQTPAIPPELRFDIGQSRTPIVPKAVPPNITPEQANDLLMEYNSAVRNGTIPPLDLHVVRQQIDERLAAQDVESLSTLQASVPHPTGDIVDVESNGEDTGPGFLTADQEAEYLARLDAKAGDPYTLAPSTQKDTVQEEKHWAELTPRELERQVELQNPQSQHNWLKTHTKVLSTNIDDDTESLASHDNAAKPSSAPARKRGGKDKNLAKQVGDRAVERAKEGWSPSAASDDEGATAAATTAGKKRTRDPDGTYRLKGSGSKGAGSSAKGKRKRSTTGDGGGEVGIKKAKVEGEGGEDDEELDEKAYMAKSGMS